MKRRSSNALSFLKLFALSLALQLFFHIPFVLLFSLWTHAVRYTYWILATVSCSLAAVLTVIALSWLWIKHRGHIFSFALPFSFLPLPVCLTIVHHIVLSAVPAAQLPYEWGKYPASVFQLYSLPFFLLTSLIVLGVNVWRRTQQQQS